MGNVSETKSRYRPARQPVFTVTMQIGIVVRDLDATLRKFAGNYRIGPWELYELTQENEQDLRENGQPIKRPRKVRSVLTMVGKVMWELVKPVDDSPKVETE